MAQDPEYLKDGNPRLLYGVWKEYGFDSEEDEEEDEDEEFENEAPPEPPGMDRLPKPVKCLLS